MRTIRLVAMDVDGVLTDGRIIFDDNGRELKAFDAHDGFGISRALRSGLMVAIITKRKSSSVTRRARELGIKDVFQGVVDKRAAYERLKRRHRLHDSEICYIGDDVPDVDLLRKAGLAVVPNDAMEEARENADLVCHQRGGRGAVREILDTILRAKKLL
ncbi:MAG TPA: HAD-IIIA family hydrolase [Bacteroidota bacterium]|nr:HAD-IIIA family hydrolase [Bacteroidota bacterium]